ncbi:MAG: hypothetical protein J6X18_02690 [Bacteroidales bacterium]|nr:hypothetical protein [Bacteroidales bacterium]
MKIAFEQYVSQDKTSSGLKTEFVSNGNTPEEKEAFLLYVFQTLGNSILPNGSQSRSLFESALEVFKNNPIPTSNKI